MTDYLLALEFDINQITRALQYTFKSAAGSAEKHEGNLAGTFNFLAGDTLHFSVTATGFAVDDVELVIKDCSLVSVSNGHLGKSALSPFSQSMAISTVSKWSNFEETEGDLPGRVKFFASSEAGLPVVAESGQWEISGYLSMEVTVRGTVYNRVFYFDPEGTTGSGTGGGWPNNE